MKIFIIIFFLNIVFFVHNSIHASTESLVDLIKNKKGLHDKSLHLKVRKIQNLTDCDLVLDHESRLEWLGGIIFPHSSRVVNQEILKKTFDLQSRFYDKSGCPIKKNQIPIKISFYQGYKLGVLSVSARDLCSFWSLGKCKKCNSSPLQSAPCSGCQKASEKFNNKQNIAIDLKFIKKNDRIIVGYKIDLDDTL